MDAIERRARELMELDGYRPDVWERLNDADRKKYRDRAGGVAAPQSEPEKQTALLVEIRDLLKEIASKTRYGA